MNGLKNVIKSSLMTAMSFFIFIDFAFSIPYDDSISIEFSRREKLVRYILFRLAFALRFDK